MNTHSQNALPLRIWFPLSVLAGLLVLSGGCATSSGEKRLMAQLKYEESQNPGNSKKEKYKKLMEAIRMAPKEPLYRLGLGDAYFKDEKLDKAEKMYLSAIKADPQYTVTYRMLGRLYMQKGQWNDATHYLMQALNQPNVINPV